MRIWLLALAATWPGVAAAQACEQPPRIPRQVIAEAMRAHGPYSLTSTTTAMIFGSEALLAIVRRRRVVQVHPVVVGIPCLVPARDHGPVAVVTAKGPGVHETWPDDALDLVSPDRGLV